MKNFFKNNSLSLAFLFLFFISIGGQIYFGLEEHNRELLAKGVASIPLSIYLFSGHFLQATFENWESEFLQMALFVVLTIFLQQKGSSESKDFEKEEEVDREPSPQRKNAPWPVKKRGMDFSNLQIFIDHCLYSLIFNFFSDSFLWKPEGRK